MTIMEYQIVKGSEEKLHVFERRMNSFIRDGWEPIGGIACVGKGLYRQAMIRRDDGIRYRKVSAPPGIADDMPDQELTFPDHPVMPSLRDIEFED